MNLLQLPIPLEYTPDDVLIVCQIPSQTDIVEPLFGELALAAGHMPEEVDVGQVGVDFGEKGGEIGFDV
jgi:hypothetical protein